MIKKLTKRIYVEGDGWWGVEQVFSPTMYDDYILVTRKSATTCHEDGTIPVEMALIDAHNSTFYPDTKKVRDALAICAPKPQTQQEARAFDVLNTSWLDMCVAPPAPDENEDECAEDE